MTKSDSLDQYQQWEGLAAIARSYKIEVQWNYTWNEYSIGAKKYDNVIDAAVALLSAFDKAKIKIPDNLRRPPLRR